MDDVIYRQAAIEVCDWWQHEYDESASRIDDIIHCIAEDIEKLPSADVRENVRGEWEGYGHDFFGDNEYRCTACKKTANIKTDFCPNCGADMRTE